MDDLADTGMLADLKQSERDFMLAAMIVHNRKLNNRQWPDGVPLSIADVTELVGLTDKPARKARNSLHKRGLILYEEGAGSPNGCGKVHLQIGHPGKFLSQIESIENDTVGYGDSPHQNSAGYGKGPHPATDCFRASLRTTSAPKLRRKSAPDYIEEELRINKISLRDTDPSLLGAEIMEGRTIANLYYICQRLWASENGEPTQRFEMQDVATADNALKHIDSKRPRGKLTSFSRRMGYRSSTQPLRIFASGFCKGKTMAVQRQIQCMERKRNFQAPNPRNE